MSSLWLYGHGMRDDRTQFNMRVEDEFLAALDKLRLAERPACSRAYMLRKLVFEAQEVARLKRERAASAQGLPPAFKWVDPQAKVVSSRRLRMSGSAEALRATRAKGK